MGLGDVIRSRWRLWLYEIRHLMNERELRILRSPHEVAFNASAIR